MSSEQITVIGATGYAGRYLVDELDRRDYRVHAVVRDLQRARTSGAYGAPALNGANTTLIHADVSDPLQLDGLCEGSTRVLSALGVTRQKANPWDIDFHANLAVLREAQRCGVRSMLYLGAIGIHRNTSLVARSKAAFAAALTQSSLDSQIINPSGYFSDLASYLGMARHRIIPLPPNPQLRLNPIHGADLATYCVDLMTSSGSVELDVGGPQVLTARDIAECAAAAVGTHPRMMSIPMPVLNAAVWAASRVSDRVGDTARFFVETMTSDAVGHCTGTRQLADWFHDLV